VQGKIDIKKKKKFHKTEMTLPGQMRQEGKQCLEWLPKSSLNKVGGGRKKWGFGDNVFITSNKIGWLTQTARAPKGGGGPWTTLRK